ncbi:hypothetical protein CCH79_00003588, partial [Gambusia affinis]
MDAFILRVISCLCIFQGECSQGVFGKRETFFVPAGGSLSLSCVVQHCGGNWTGNWKRENLTTSATVENSARHSFTIDPVSANRSQLHLKILSVRQSDEGLYKCNVKWRDGSHDVSHWMQVNVTKGVAFERKLLHRVLVCTGAFLCLPVILGLARCLSSEVKQQQQPHPITEMDIMIDHISLHSLHPDAQCQRNALLLLTKVSNNFNFRSLKHRGKKLTSLTIPAKARVIVRTHFSRCPEESKGSERDSSTYCLLICQVFMTAEDRRQRYGAVRSKAIPPTEHAHSDSEQKKTPPFNRTKPPEEPGSVQAAIGLDRLGCSTSTLGEMNVLPTVSSSSRASVSPVVLLKLLVLDEEREMLGLQLLPLLHSLCLMKGLLMDEQQRTKHFTYSEGALCAFTGALWQSPATEAGRDPTCHPGAPVTMRTHHGLHGMAPDAHGPLICGQGSKQEVDQRRAVRNKLLQIGSHKAVAREDRPPCPPFSSLSSSPTCPSPSTAWLCLCSSSCRLSSRAARVRPCSEFSRTQRLFRKRVCGCWMKVKNGRVWERRPKRRNVFSCCNRHLTTQRVLNLHQNVGVQEVGGDHVWDKRCGLFLEDRGHNIISNVSFPLELWRRKPAVAMRPAWAHALISILFLTETGLRGGRGSCWCLCIFDPVTPKLGQDHLGRTTSKHDQTPVAPLRMQGYGQTVIYILQQQEPGYWQATEDQL